MHSKNRHNARILAGPSAGSVVSLLGFPESGYLLQTRANASAADWASVEWTIGLGPSTARLWADMYGDFECRVLVGAGTLASTNEDALIALRNASFCVPTN